MVLINTHYSSNCANALQKINNYEQVDENLHGCV